MNLKIFYSKQADKFLERNSHSITEEGIDNLLISAIKKILKIDETNIDLKMLKGVHRGYFRVRKGDLRIIFSLQKGHCLEVTVKDIDFRGNIYK